MMRFFDFLFPPRSDERCVRATSTEEFLALLAPQLIVETRPETVSLLPFHDTRVRSALHEAKYHGNERAFTLLGTTLAEYLTDTDVGFTKSYILVPVPLGRARRKERGFNQAEEIVRHALRGIDGIGLDTSLLERLRETPTQVALPREERAKNMHGAFRATRRADPALLYIVLDDVLTTGATLQAAIDALQEAGATNILPVALAH